MKPHRLCIQQGNDICTETGLHWHAKTSTWSPMPASANLLALLVTSLRETCRNYQHALVSCGHLLTRRTFEFSWAAQLLTRGRRLHGPALPPSRHPDRQTVESWDAHSEFDTGPCPWILHLQGRPRHWRCSLRPWR